MPIIADDAPTFPKCPGYGFRVDPFILVKIIEREGGFERVDRKWSQARRQFDGVPIKDNVLGDVEEILYFWLAVGGMAGAFRFKDFTDFQSCRSFEEPAATDQPFTIVDDSPGGFRLVKVYSVPSHTHVRPIRRPIASSIIVSNEVGVVQPSSAYSLDASTGILTPNGGFAGTPTAWGGRFDVWCRFNASFTPEIIDKNIQDANVSIIEKREQ